MRKFLTACFLTAISTVSSVNATVTPIKSDYNEFYQALQHNMPYTLHQLSFMVAFLQLSSEQIGKAKLNTAIDPTNPQFAQCMQSGIERKFYEPTLKQSFDKYLQKATPTDFQHDLTVLRQTNFQANNELYKDIFAIYSKGKTSQDNINISNRTKLYYNTSLT